MGKTLFTSTIFCLSGLLSAILIRGAAAFFLGFTTLGGPSTYLDGGAGMDMVNFNGDLKCVAEILEVEPTSPGTTPGG